MNNKIKKFEIGSIAPFVLFAIFSICIITVLLTGASLYREQNDKDSIGYEKRTISRYITTRIRQSDLDNTYFIGDFYLRTPENEGNSLFLYEIINNELYYTCIYCYDGYLYELFTESENKFEPGDGEVLAPLGALKFTMLDDIICANITYTDGDCRMIMIYPRSAQEVAYEE